MDLPLRLLFGAPVFALLLSACFSPPSTLGRTCASNGECSSELVCADGLCSAPGDVMGDDVTDDDRVVDGSSADAGTPPLPPEPEVVTDSVLGFSGEQGKGGWRYGYIEPETSTEFVEMTEFHEDTWWVKQGMYWTHIGPRVAHPNGKMTSSGRLPVEQWAVRRWVSTIEGPVTITGSLAKANATSISNGVLGRLAIDGVPHWAAYIEGDDGVGQSFTLTTTVGVGSAVDWIVEPWASQDLGDATLLTGTIVR